MILLGLHLRHGIWSAFQSLGTMKPSLSSVIYGLGVLVAILVGLGFLVLPVWIYFGGGGV
jgi:succinate dehydrogenase / fumarate reductase cytochrome b subunit